MIVGALGFGRIEIAVAYLVWKVNTPILFDDEVNAVEAVVLDHVSTIVQDLASRIHSLGNLFNILPQVFELRIQYNFQHRHVFLRYGIVTDNRSICSGRAANWFG